MPSGDGTLTHGCWQPLPGETDARIWPFVRKVDTFSSNSYLVASGDLLVLIDPGGLPEQADELASVIEAESTARPFLALLTHAHIDHCRVLMNHPYFMEPGRVAVAIQEEGARALAAADTRLTQAALLGVEITPLSTAVPLFAGQESERSRTEIRWGSHGGRLAPRYITAPDGILRECQVLQAGASCPVILYHTPGHSPDSICIQAGSVLFIGDLLFAANPGIAGISGWDRAALLKSIDTVIAILEEKTITHCCPGHGRILTAEEAIRALRGVKKDAETLEGIVELDRSRAKETALYAEGLIDEVGEIFTIIAARLLFTSYVLDELEESAEAGEIVSLIDGDRVDALLNEFQQFLASYRAGSKLDVHLALKAGQIVQKFEKVFVQENLELIIDPDYLRRLQRLLNDYLTVLRGFRPPRMLQQVAVAEILPGFIGRLKQGGTSVEEMLDSADDNAAFTRALVRRIARVTIFDEVTCEIPPGAEGALTEIDAAIFCDLIRTFLEDIAGSGGNGMVIRITPGEQQVTVSIELNAPGIMPAFREIRRRFLARECERCGGRLSCREEGTPASVSIALPRVARTL